MSSFAQLVFDELCFRVAESIFAVYNGDTLVI